MSKTHFITLTGYLLLGLPASAALLLSPIQGAPVAENVVAEGDRQKAVRFEDKRLTELYLHYKAQTPRAAEQDTAVALRDLPGPLQTMIEQGKTGLLDEILTTAQTMLAQQAPDLFMPVEFFSADAAAGSAEELAHLLDKTSSYLKIAEGAITDLHHYLDWYPDNDWSRRFGDNGFYDHLCQLRQSLILTKAMLSYYQAGLRRYESDGGKDVVTKNDPDLELKQSFQELTELHNSSGHLFVYNGKDQTQDSTQDPTQDQDRGQAQAEPNDITAGLVNLRFWLVRLARSLACDEPKYLDQFRQYLNLSIQLPTSAELGYEIRLESLHYTVLTNDDVNATESRIRKLEKWLKAIEQQIENYPVKLLQLYLLEYKLCKPYGKSMQSIFGRLAALAQQYPQLCPTVSTFIAGCLHEPFITATETDQFTRDWSDFDLLALGRYYQTTRPRAGGPSVKDCCDLAIRLYESVLRSRASKNPHYPQVLYDLALCHYQLAEHYRQLDDDENAVKETIMAINNWDRLAREFPAWSASGDSEQISSAEAARLGGSLSYNLFVTDPERYGDLARRTLATFVGQIKPGQAVPDGPFAQTDAAKQYRYHYGMTLRQGEHYEQAADMFAAVDDDDPHKFAARYWAIHCRYYHYQNDNSPTAPANINQQCIGELTALIEDNPADPLTINATLLLTHIFQQEERISTAIEVVGKALQVHPDSAQLIVTALNLLQRQQADLLSLHALGPSRKEELIRHLTNSLPLAQKISRSLKPDVNDEQTILASRVFLEQVTLASVTFVENPRPRDFDQMLQEADALMTQLEQYPVLKRSLWLIRCRALLTFARGDYGDSQQLWYRIRRSTEKATDETMRYYWWEARYFGLCCLPAGGDLQNTAHTIDVLIRSRPDYTGPWIERLKLLRQQAQTQQP